jgi:hypothetical protein
LGRAKVELKFLKSSGSSQTFKSDVDRDLPSPSSTTFQFAEPEQKSDLPHVKFEALFNLVSSWQQAVIPDQAVHDELFSARGKQRQKTAFEPTQKALPSSSQPNERSITTQHI